MVVLTRVVSFGYCELQHTLIKNDSPSFSNSDRTNSRLFVKHDHVARHKFTIGCSEDILIGYPVYKNFKTNTIFLLSSLNFKIHPCRDSKSVPPEAELPNFSVQPIVPHSP